MRNNQKLNVINNMIDTKIKRQVIPMPATKEKLFVTKHIADYEPMPVSHSVAEKFLKNIKEGPKRIFPEVPTNSKLPTKSWSPFKRGSKRQSKKKPLSTAN